MPNLVPYSFTALIDTNSSGDNIVASQAVSVKFDYDGTYATIYSDSAGTTPIAQPGAITDSNGVLEFWVEAGRYQVESGGRTEYLVIDDGSMLKLTSAQVATSKHLRTGDTVLITDRANSLWDIGSYTANGYNIIEATNSSLQAKLRKTNPLDIQAFGAVADGVTDDTAAILAAVSNVANGGSIKFSHGIYAINGCITFASLQNIEVDFDGSVFLVGDTGTSGSFTLNAVVYTGKIGFLFDQCDNLTIKGSAILLGQGTLGVTSLAGIVFSDCDTLKAPDPMHFDTMAAGRFVMNCNSPLLGDAYGNIMDGLQTFESPPTTNAGTVEILVGCQYGSSGNAISINAEKPARYMSVGAGRNNIGMKCGIALAEYDGSSLTSHALALRSAVDCVFGACISIGGNTSVLQIQQYSGDNAAGYNVDRCHVEAVLGESGSTGASVDSLIYADTTDTAQIGEITIGTVNGFSDGEHGIFNTCAKLRINKLVISGDSTRFMQIAPVSSSGLKAEVQVDHMDMGAFGGSAQPITIGKGGKFVCGTLNVTSGPTQAVSIIVFYNSSIGDGSYHDGIHIGQIQYARNGSTNNYGYLVYDASSTAGPATVSIENVISSDGSNRHVLWGSNDFNILNGNIFGTAAPTSGTWRIGDIVWDITPVSAQQMGWTCSVAGNPGTWLTMASYA